MCSVLGLYPFLLDLAACHVRCWVRSVCAPDLHAAVADLVRRALVSVRLGQASVRWQCSHVGRLVMEVPPAITLASNDEVRLFEELNALGGQLELGVLASGVSEGVVVLSRSGLAARTNLVMGRANVVRDEGVQRSIDSLGLRVFVFEILTGGCRFLDLGYGVSDRC